MEKPGSVGRFWTGVATQAGCWFQPPEMHKVEKVLSRMRSYQELQARTQGGSGTDFLASQFLAQRRARHFLKAQCLDGATEETRAALDELFPLMTRLGQVRVGQALFMGGSKEDASAHFRKCLEEPASFLKAVNALTRRKVKAKRYRSVGRLLAACSACGMTEAISKSIRAWKSVDPDSLKDIAGYLPSGRVDYKTLTEAYLSLGDRKGLLALIDGICADEEGAACAKAVLHRCIGEDDKELSDEIKAACIGQERAADCLALTGAYLDWGMEDEVKGLAGECEERHNEPGLGGVLAGCLQENCYDLLKGMLLVGSAKPRASCHQQAIAQAVKLHHLAGLEQLLNWLPRGDARMEGWRCALKAAIEYGFAEGARAVLNRASASGEEHTLLGKGLEEALHDAASRGHAALISVLSPYFELNALDKFGYTAFHHAVLDDKPKALEALIHEAGKRAKEYIDLPIQDVHYYRGTTGYPSFTRNQTPLALAVMNGRLECIDRLMERDANRYVKMEGTGSLLHLAVQYGQEGAIRHLLDRYEKKVRCLLHWRDDDGLTPLMLAALRGEPGIVLLLGQRYPDDIDEPGREGKTALHCAAEAGQRLVISLLVRLGASIDAKTESGEGLQELFPVMASSSLRALLAQLLREQAEGNEFPPDFFRYPPLTLSFQGGGTKGLAYVGALAYLEAQLAEKGPLLGLVERLIGTSVGALFAALGSVGYTAEEMRRELQARPLHTLLDDKGKVDALLAAAKVGKKGGATPKNVGIALARVAKVIMKQKDPLGAFLELQKQTGLFSGEKLRAWLDGLIEAKTGRKNLTFGELAGLVREERGDKGPKAGPWAYKHLHVFASDISKALGGYKSKAITRFSSEDPECKDMIISDAAVNSARFPGVFQEGRIFVKSESGRVPMPGDERRFLDGGFINNNPVTACDNTSYVPGHPEPGRPVFNSRTLGLGLFSREQLKQKEVPSGLLSIPRQIANIYFQAERLLHTFHEDEAGRFVWIDNQGVGPMDFDLTEKQQQDLFNSGQAAAAQFLGHASPIVWDDEDESEGPGLVSRLWEGAKRLPENKTALVATGLVVGALGAYVVKDRAIEYLRRRSSGDEGEEG